MNFIRNLTEKLSSITRLSADDSEKQKKEEENNNQFVADLEKGMPYNNDCASNSFLRGKTSDTGIIDVDTSNYLSGRNDVYSRVNTVRSYPTNPRTIKTCEDNEKYVYISRNPRRKEKGLSEIDTSNFDFDYYPSHSRFEYISFNFNNSRKQ
jgi:hypothetical protein